MTQYIFKYVIYIIRKPNKCNFFIKRAPNENTIDRT